MCAYLDGGAACGEGPNCNPSIKVSTSSSVPPIIVIDIAYPWSSMVRVDSTNDS